MTDRDKIAHLLTALTDIEKRLGIRRDFVPLGPALDIAGIIRDVRRDISKAPAEH